MGAPWGWLTCIDAAECDAVAINSKEVFQSFIDELLDSIEMVKIGDLHVFWCDTNDPNKIGYSIFQLLQDSNISAHFCSADRNSAYVDVFSCKSYDPEIVVEVFQKYFSANKLHYNTITRKAPS